MRKSDLCCDISDCSIACHLPCPVKSLSVAKEKPARPCPPLLRSSTRISTRAAASGSTQPSKTPATPPESRSGESLTDLLGLIREQVRAELQSQQTIAGQDAMAAGSTGQQVVDAATIEQSTLTISGMLNRNYL